MRPVAVRRKASSPRELKALMSALDQSHAMIWFRPDGTIVDANRLFLEAMGYQSEDIVGRHHRIFLPAGEAETVAYRQFWERLRKGEFLSGEFQRVGHGGREVWLRATYVPILSGGHPISVLKLATDVTAEKEKTMDSESQVAAIGRSQAVIRFTPDGTVIEANTLFLHTMGYRLEEVVGRHHRIFVDPEEAQSSEYRQFWEALGRGTPQAGEFRRRAHDGQDVWLRATYTPIVSADGKVMSVIKYAVDITLEKQQNRDHRQQMEALHRSQAVIEFTLEGIVTAANDNFLKAVGYQREEVLGQHHRQFLFAEDAESADYRTFWTRLQEGKVIQGVVRRKNRNGSDVWLQATYQPILDENGRPVKVVKYATDITALVGARTQYAANMESIIASIRSIASQIDLVSLNAAIEAARAGAAGLGFGIVAREITKLASQVAAATARIDDEIRQLKTH